MADTKHIDQLDGPTLASLLASLVGRDCSASQEKAPANPEAGMVIRGRFVDDEGALIAAVSSDVPFAAFTGAAIGLLPVGGAEDAIDEKELSGTLEEAYAEVLNVLSRLFNTPGRKHCRYQGMQSAPLPALDVEAKHTSRFTVNVTGYGKGVVTFLAA